MNTVTSTGEHRSEVTTLTSDNIPYTAFDVGKSLELENYTKGETVDVVSELDPFVNLKLDMTNCIQMKISAGGKIRNYMGFAHKEFAKEDRRLITFSGSGEAVSKVITCVEIMKRKHKDLHQINKIFFKMKEDFWEPKEEHLDRLKVTRHIPAISVLLSKDQLDDKEPGYQAPGSFEEDWAKGTAQAKAKRKDNLNKKRMKMQQSGGSGRRERQKHKGDASQSEEGSKKQKQDKRRNRQKPGKQTAPPTENKTEVHKPKTDG